MPPKHYNLSCFTMQVDLATGRSLSPAKMVRHNSTIGNWVSEGPHIIKRGEWYYLITADGGTHTAHQEWVCRSKQGPFGPWEEGPPEINPVIYNGDDEVVTMTGHSELKWLGLARTGSDGVLVWLVLYRPVDSSRCSGHGRGDRRAVVGRLPRRPTAEWPSVSTRSRDLLDAGGVGGRLAGREWRSQDWPLRSLVGGTASITSRVELGRRLQAKHGSVSFPTHPQTCRGL